MNNKLLDISDLHVGMKVNTRQLCRIYDTYILLSNTVSLNDGSTEDIIEFIGQKQTQKMKDIIEKCKAQYGVKPMLFAQTNIQYKTRRIDQNE